MEKIWKNSNRKDFDLAMKGFESISLAGRHLFIKSENSVLIILKGHLIVEQMLRIIIKKNFLRPQLLDNARLTFYQSLCIVKAFYKGNIKTDWLWIAIEKLNNLRNQLAHHLEPKNQKEIIDDFLTYIEKHKEKIPPLQIKDLISSHPETQLFPSPFDGGGKGGGDNNHPAPLPQGEREFPDGN